MQLRKGSLVTAAGIMAALGSVPILVATSGVTPPLWWAKLSFPFILIGIIGTALMGWAAKGADDHSTVAEVETATVKETVKEAEKVAPNPVEAAKP